MNHFKLEEEGLDIKLVASEPLVRAPVAIKFDAKGRLWAVEMKGYMPDTTGPRKNGPPSGKIVILEDRDGDGYMDQRKVFMDSLSFPRAISFYGGGVLIAEPPKLLYVTNENDHAGKVTVVDHHYTAGGNVEHQPNGLLRGIDNWIYNANSTKRYRKINGNWVTQHTHLRGQWGITQDSYGRLFYNNNHTNLIGDYFLPGLGAWNKDQKKVSGFREVIVADNRVYPIHSTPGVNRGYRDKVLDDSLRLKYFTAASGPVIYRGGALGPAFNQNAFVAEPAGNLVKRDILAHKGYKVSGKQAYQEKEFLASDDERFRPVELKNGPEGGLYVTDMYRGVIQDVKYLTPYLKNQIKMRKLQHPLDRGRIYKIVPKDTSLHSRDLSHKSTRALVKLLDNANGWVRKTAQRLITDREKSKAEPLLRKKMKSDDFLIGRIHAFWSLQGLGELKTTDIFTLLRSHKPPLQHQAIAAATARMNEDNAPGWVKEGRRLLKEDNNQLAAYVAFLGASAVTYAPKKACDLLLKLALAHKNNPYVADAVISGLSNHEKVFLDRFQQHNADTSTVFYRHIKKVIKNGQKRQAEMENKQATKQFGHGKKLFKSYCQACHGSDGAGIRSMGAPLSGSSWVTEGKDNILAIVLNGLMGPIKVSGKTYRPPEVSGVMPSFGANGQLSDKDLAQLLNYIRHAWGNEAGAIIKASDVARARKQYNNRTEPFTMDELEK